MNSPSAVTSWLSTGRIRARKDEHMAKNSVICILLIGIVIAILPRTAWSMLYIPWNGENAVYQKAQTDTDTAGLQSMIKGTATGINWPYKIAVNSSNIFLVINGPIIVATLSNLSSPNVLIGDMVSTPDSRLRPRE